MVPPVISQGFFFFVFVFLVSPPFQSLDSFPDGYLGGKRIYLACQVVSNKLRHLFWSGLCC